MYTDCTHVRLERKTIWHTIAYLLASDHIKIFEVYKLVLAYLTAYLEEEPYTPHSNHHVERHCLHVVVSDTIDLQQLEPIKA